MKKHYLSLTFFVFAISFSYAQESLIFNYDEAGNQLERNYECIGCLLSTQKASYPSVPDDLRAYPNPTSGIINIDWVGEYQGKVTTVLVTSLDGNYSQNFVVTQSIQKLTVDITSKPSVVYIVSFYLNNSATVFSRKIIKL